MFNKTKKLGCSEAEATDAVSDKKCGKNGVTATKENNEVATYSPSSPDADELANILTSLFECPVCYDYVMPPILQCASGHLVCIACRSKLVQCPTCRGPLENIRNLALEKVACTVNFPFECKASLTEVDYEEICKCPYPGIACDWEGPLYLVLQHLMSVHMPTLLMGEDIIFLATNINTTGSADWIMMQKCFGVHFMLVLEKKMRNDHLEYFAVVQLIGTKEQAEKFVYSLELIGRNERKLLWTANPIGIHDSVKTFIRNSDCLAFDTSLAKQFVDNKGDLPINVTITPL